MGIINTRIDITVVSSSGYSYEIDSENFVVQYKETGRTPNPSDYISFGSREEMKAVAEAMLKALELTE